MPNTDYTTVTRMAGEVPARIAHLTITSQESYDKAAGILRDIVTIRKGIVEHHLELKQKTHAAWQAAIAAEKKLLDPVVAAQTQVKQAIGHYDSEKALEQERLNALARQAQDRLAKAERKREIDEAERAAREEIAQLIEDAPDEATAELILSQASQAVAGAVAEVRAEPLPVVEAVATPVMLHKADGVGSRVTYKCEVVSVKELCQAIGAGDAPAPLSAADRRDRAPLRGSVDGRIGAAPEPHARGAVPQGLTHRPR